MSTFSLLNTAYSGLAAARAALEVTGQNVANVNTEGYTRQRVEQVSIPGNDYSSRYTLGLNIGQGTQVTGISRLADTLIDARVRDTAGSSGYWSATSAALATVETQLAEPTAAGLSATLDTFWSAWGGMSNNPGTSAAANTLLSAASNLTGRIADGWTAARTGWMQQRESAAATVSSANQAATAVATLNQEILKITVAGGNANELIDRRSAALTTLSSLVGATTRTNTNGTIDVIASGNTLVSGFTARAFVLTGSVSMESANTNAVGLAFADRPGVAVQAEGGTLAGQIAALAPAANGGVFLQTAAAYDAVATAVATAVNAVHVTGKTSTGATGLSFFSLDASKPAALGLKVVPTSLAGIAAAATTAGTKDGSIADAIGQLGAGDSAPDVAWNAFVTGIGSRAQAATTRSTVADTASDAARSAQTSQSSVDLDEETANLVVFQHAYQGAARVLTAIDEMLDTLINRTGLVGRA